MNEEERIRIPRELKCCRFCGRDTRADDSICFTCRGGNSESGKGRGRKSLNKEQIESIERLDDQARADNEGWYYDDD